MIHFEVNCRHGRIFSFQPKRTLNISPFSLIFPKIPKWIMSTCPEIKDLLYKGRN